MELFLIIGIIVLVILSVGYIFLNLFFDKKVTLLTQVRGVFRLIVLFYTLYIFKDIFNKDDNLAYVHWSFFIILVAYLGFFLIYIKYLCS